MKSLANLDLNNTQVTDAGLENLKGHSSLRRLDRNNTQATAVGRAALMKALPKCRIFTLDSYR